MSAAHANAIATEPPILRIAPPQGWWEVDFRELWQFRELIYFFVWRDIKIRYKQTAIGAAWAILQPALAMIVFALFFGKLAHMPTEGLPILVFYYAALLPWMYFANSLANATSAMVLNQAMITKVYFPRLALPISAVLSGLLDFAIGCLLLVPLLAYYHIRPGLPLLWLPVFLFLAVLMALGVGPVALGDERDVPRRALRRAFSHSVVAVRVRPWPTRAPSFPRSGAGSTA